MTAIRNFIYLDNDKLNSLYSQVFKGVAEAIVESYFGQTEDKNEVKNIGKTSEEKVVKASGTFENKILHDHMYNKFEDKLQDKIIYCNGLNDDLVKPNSIIKVTGKTRIEDYNRLDFFLKQFNKLGEALGYMEKFSQGNAKNISARQIAATNGFNMDKKYTESLSLFTSAFESDRYEIVIKNEDDDYRGIADKKYLRSSPDDIRILYGNYPCMDWTMVGQVTQIYPINTDNEMDDQEIIEESNDVIKHKFSQMFKSLNAVENAFFSYGSKTVYHVLPIAIYIENIL